MVSIFSNYDYLSFIIIHSQTACTGNVLCTLTDKQLLILNYTSSLHNRGT